jgi:hypothetical protein
MSPEINYQHKTSYFLKVTEPELAANAIMSLPEAKNDRVVNRVNRYKGKPNIVSLFVLGITAQGILRKADSALRRTITEIIEQVRKDDSSCQVNASVIAPSGDEILGNIVVPSVPTGVNIFCNAENCCQVGVRLAVPETDARLAIQRLNYALESGQF